MSEVQRQNYILDGLVQYVCMHCGCDNWLHCKAMHSSDVTCEEFEYDIFNHAKTLQKNLFFCPDLFNVSFANELLMQELYVFDFRLEINAYCTIIQRNSHMFECP